MSKCRIPGCRVVHPFVAPPSNQNNSCYVPTSNDDEGDNSSESDAITKSSKAGKSSVSSENDMKTKKNLKRTKISSTSTATTSSSSENSASSNSSDDSSPITSSSSPITSSSSSSTDPSGSSEKDVPAPSKGNNEVPAPSSSSKKGVPAPFKGEKGVPASSKGNTSKGKKEVPALLTNSEGQQNLGAENSNTPILKSGTSADSTKYKSECVDADCNSCNAGVNHNSNVRNIFFGITGALVVLMISYLVYIKYKAKGSSKKSANYKEFLEK